MFPQRHQRAGQTRLGLEGKCRCLFGGKGGVASLGDAGRVCCARPAPNGVARDGRRERGLADRHAEALADTIAGAAGAPL